MDEPELRQQKNNKPPNEVAFLLEPSLITELIAKVLADRDMANVEHWKTRSYAAHMAMGAFYEDVVGALDVAVEAYIGAFGPVGEVPMADRAPFSIETLRETSDWIEVNRMEISSESDAVANLLDGITAVYLACIYKLEQFQ